MDLSQRIPDVDDRSICGRSDAAPPSAGTADAACVQVADEVGPPQWSSHHTSETAPVVTLQHPSRALSRTPSKTLSEALGRLHREENGDSDGVRRNGTRKPAFGAHSCNAELSSDLLDVPKRMVSTTRTSVVPERGTFAWYRWRVRRIIDSTWFDAVIGLLVLLNSIQIGVEQTYRLEDRDDEIPEYIAACENLFLTIYAVELVARFFGCGWLAIEDNWVRFDCVLVFSSVLYQWVLSPFETGSETAGLLVILRTVRLARLARTLRLLIKFRVLWMLVRGLLSSAETMIYTLVVLLIMLYVFATIGTELITLRSRSPGNEGTEEFQEMVDKYFSTLPDAMLTLMQFACLDSIGVIYRPMIQHDYALAAYFMAIILIIPVVLMNLVTAIIVNSAMEQATQDKDALKLQKIHRQEKIIRKVQVLFHELDEDDSGKVSREEMRLITEEEKEILFDLCGMEEDPLVIFDQLDVDGSGELDIDEFCAGIWKTVTAKTPMELQRMEKQMKVLMERQVETDRRSEDIAQWMHQMQRGMNLLQESLNINDDDHRRGSLMRSMGSEDLYNPHRSKDLISSVGKRVENLEESRSFSEFSDHSYVHLGAATATHSANMLRRKQRSRPESPPAPVKKQPHVASAAPLAAATTGPHHEDGTQNCEIESLRQQLFAAQATIAVLQLQQKGNSSAEGDFRPCFDGQQWARTQDKRGAWPTGVRSELHRSTRALSAGRIIDTGAAHNPRLDITDAGEVQQPLDSPATSRGTPLSTASTGRSIDHLAIYQCIQESQESQESWTYSCNTPDVQDLDDQLRDLCLTRYRVEL